MGMTNDEKQDLIRVVKHLKKLGVSKTDAIDKICRVYSWKRATVTKYWKVFNGA